MADIVQNFIVVNFIAGPELEKPKYGISKTYFVTLREFTRNLPKSHVYRSCSFENSYGQILCSLTLKYWKEMRKLSQGEWRSHGSVVNTFKMYN